MVLYHHVLKSNITFTKGKSNQYDGNIYQTISTTITKINKNLFALTYFKQNANKYTLRSLPMIKRI